MRELGKGGPQTLAGHLEQAESRDLANLHAGPVRPHSLAQTILDGALVLAGEHVDKVDHDESANIPNPELGADLVGRLEVGVERGLLDVGALGGTRRVDVDSDQCLGGLYHNCPARWQTHLTCEGRLNLAFDLVAGEQRRRVFVMLELAQVVRHDLLHEVFRGLVNLLAVDQNLGDVVAQIVADSTNSDRGILEDEHRRRSATGGGFDSLPEGQ